MDIAERNLDELEPLEPGRAPAGAEAEDDAAEAAPDLLRLYLREIAKYPLLTAAQEVALGQRIERGQVRLRRALAAVPWAVGRLLELADKVRAERQPLGDLFRFPEGREPTAAEVRLRFGLDAGEHTLEQIGQRFGLTRERIRQIEAKALQELRPPLAGTRAAGRPGEPGRR